MIRAKVVEQLVGTLTADLILKNCDKALLAGHLLLGREAVVKKHFHNRSSVLF